MIRRWIVGLCAMVMVIGLAGLAHAAELTLSPPTQPSVTLAEKCAQAEVKLAGIEGNEELTVPALPAECGGLPLTVWLHDGTTHWSDELIVPEGGSAVTVPAADFTVRMDTSALVTIDTWPMPTTMDIQPPFISCRTADVTLDCAVKIVDSNDWSDPNPNHWQRTIKISTDPVSSAPVELVFNLSQPPAPIPETRQLLAYDHTVGHSEDLTERCNAEPRTLAVSVTAGKQYQFQGNPNYNPHLGGNVLLACP